MSGVRKSRAKYPTGAAKVSPRMQGRVVELHRRAGWVLVWKPAPRVARRRGRKGEPGALHRTVVAKRWANLVVFLLDHTKPKRSYRVAWNGERTADTVQWRTLVEREPAVAAQVVAWLPTCRRKIVSGVGCGERQPTDREGA